MSKMVHHSITTQAPPDGSRPGVYYAHLSDMKAMPKNELEVIAYHEGLPGHHMQISIAQELKRHSQVPHTGWQHGLCRRVGALHRGTR